MGYTEREREIMRDWPVVTEEDITRLNDLFPHYILYRKEKLMKLARSECRRLCLI